MAECAARLIPGFTDLEDERCQKVGAHSKIQNPHQAFHPSTKKRLPEMACTGTTLDSRSGNKTLTGAPRLGWTASPSEHGPDLQVSVAEPGPAHLQLARGLRALEVGAVTRAAALRQAGKGKVSDDPGAGGIGTSPKAAAEGGAMGH